VIHADATVDLAEPKRALEAVLKSLEEKNVRQLLH
jgi:hypothetical protein